jgi:hypothetical protein
MKILLFAGAGTSIELGVPGMFGMAEEFVTHAKQWRVEPALVQQLMGESQDIEYLIEALDRICTARSSLAAIGQDTVSLDRVDRIRAEVEWFVQHVAERVVTNDARIMWGSVLRAASPSNVTIVTTNYDRAIELAANAEQVLIDDGFSPFGEGETTSWVGFGQDGNRLNLVKLHGSTDWYAEGKLASPTKLRHPMPLFGRAALRLTNGKDLGSALVLPSREKLLTHDPYPRLSQTFLNAADSCDMAIFVGSSLRDYHIRGAAQTTSCRVPVFIVNPSGDTYGLERVRPIKQCASTFLIATLPNALLSPTPIDALELIATKSNDQKGLLPAVREALDTDAKADQRCLALEQLDDMEAALDPFLLRQLLRDSNPRVARYSLGLILLSHERNALIDAASTTSHTEDPAFREDFQLLRDLAQKGLR